MEYNVRLEFKLPPTEESGEQLVTAFEAFHPGVGPSDSDNGKTDVWLTLDAKTARQAGELGLALAAKQVDLELTAFEVITTEDFDRREWATPVPDLIGSDEAADILGISRQAIGKQVSSGKLRGIRVGERTVVFVRREVEARARESVVLGFNKGGGPREEHLREVLDPAYESLRIVGALPAYTAYLDARAGDEHNAALAEVWAETQADVLASMRMLGYDTDGVVLTATRLGRA